MTELSKTEQRLRDLLDGIPQLVWRAVDVGVWTWASPQWIAFTGLSLERSLNLGWLDALHSEDREYAVRVWEHAPVSGTLEMEVRLRQARTDTYRWFKIRATPVHDRNGAIVEWLGTCTDMQDVKELQERQKQLLAELQHRVRNLLAMVRSIVRQTTEGHDSVEDYTAHLVGRLDAMARTQAVLTKAAGAKVNLETMLRDELRASLADEERLTLTGPEIALAAKSAETVALALHELVTNSIKYGALARDGTILVRWSQLIRDGEPWLELEWLEQCDLRFPRPVHRGFGTELIEEKISYELGGEGSLRTTADGIVARVAFPLRDGSSILDNAPGIEESSDGIHGF